MHERTQARFKSPRKWVQSNPKTNPGNLVPAASVGKTAYAKTEACSIQLSPQEEVRDVKMLPFGIGDGRSKPMSLCLQPELWVVVQEAERPNAPVPRPLSSGFSKDRAYRILGIHAPSETSEAYFILCNDRNEIWFISNQHFRVQNGSDYSRPVSLGMVEAADGKHNGSMNGRASAK
jgi:hypothetical protein